MALTDLIGSQSTGGFSLMELIPGKFIALGIIIALIIAGSIVFFILALRDTAKKLKVPHDWASISWLLVTHPYLMANMARKPWWPVIVAVPASILISLLSVFGKFFVALSFIVSLSFAGYVIYLNWRICQMRSRPGWWAIIALASILLAIIFSLIGGALVIFSILLLIFAIVWQFIMWGILAWRE